MTKAGRRRGELRVKRRAGQAARLFLSGIQRARTAAERIRTEM